MANALGFSCVIVKLLLSLLLVIIYLIAVQSLRLRPLSTTTTTAAATTTEATEATTTTAALDTTTDELWSTPRQTTAIAAAAAVAALPHWNNCCPAGALLMRRFNHLRGVSYACAYNDTTTASTPMSEAILAMSAAKIYAHATPVWGYRIAQVAASTIADGEVGILNDGIPKCGSELQLNALPRADGRDALIAMTGSCVVSIEDTVSALVCVDGDGREPASPAAPSTPERLTYARKCCPLQHVYDVNQRRCQPYGSGSGGGSGDGGGTQYDAYGELFRNGVAAAVFEDTPLDCAKHRVLVEYHLRDDAFVLAHSELYVNATRKRYKYADYCVEAVRGAHPLRVPQFLVRVCEQASVCNRLPCIRRCCADGEMYTRGNATSYCRKDEADVAYHSFESLDISGNFTKPAVFGIYRSLDCLKYRLDPDSYADEAHTISEFDGTLLVHATRKQFTNTEYCVEKIRNATWGDQKLYTFLCFDTKVVGNDRIRFKMYPIGLLISCSFYAMTLIIYLSIPKLRNLPGKILICLVCSLFAAYLSIALGQLMPAPNDDVCFASGFFVYFCLMAAFAWMNVMCFDIWQTFGSAKKKQCIKRTQTRRFICYSAYGWGVPTLLTIITVSLTKSNLLSDNVRPQFGHGRCWFTYDALGSANLIFFSGPVGILFLFNFVLFSLTLRYCNKVKREIFRMQSSNNEKPALRRRFIMDKARFAMNTKLFVVMGITWLLELLSIMFYDHKKTFFWVISDSFNVLLGVFVFFIFVFKKRVWGLILERVGKRRSATLKSTMPNLTYATPSTCMQSMSMTRLNVLDGNTKLLSSNPNPNGRLSPHGSPKLVH